jgi:lipopolysaccharide transport system ATP-binding protein
MSTVISVEGVSKAYRLGQIGSGTIHEDLSRWWARLRGKPDPFLKIGQDDHARRVGEQFWALDNVSFDVKRGEVLGIIGRNGAGKSTLLKILSQVTSPTSGQIKIKGRVASLLEVGTGFHPELTGRENIFLNGAILGMTKAEVRRKFDEIVAFAEISEFIDTPVKRYSSGMYVRLAFAVAAHLEPEILIVDEVLAVGDIQFQKKCLGKMQEVSTGQGRTVLFVSHNMNAMDSLCQRIVHLEQGKAVAITDDVRAGIASYLSGPVVTHSVEWRNPGNAFDNPWFCPVRFYLGDRQGNVARAPFRNDQPVYVYIEGHVEKEDMALNVGYALYDDAGTLLYWSVQTDVAENSWPSVARGRNVLRSEVPQRVLNQGKYRMELLVALYYREWLVGAPGSSAPTIELSIQGGLSDSPYWMEKRPGLLAPVCPWTLEQPAGDIISDPTKTKK